MIRVLNKNLRFVDFLRKYTFAQYQRCFRDIGTFQIDVVLENENMYLLDRAEQYFVLFGYEDFGIIEEIEKQEDSETEKTIKLSGRMALSILTKRIVMKTFKYSGLSYNFIKNVILRDLVNSSDSSRNMNVTVNCISEDILVSRSSKINKAVTGGYVWDAVLDVLELDKFGLRMVPVVKPVSGETDINVNEWVIDVIPGIDRTKGNNFGNEAVVFSQSLSNIKTTEYTTKTSDYRNIAYIAGEGEGTDRKWYEKQINTDDSKGNKGFLRSELWIDARDIQSEDEEGNIITDEEYETLIQNRVDEKAKENTLSDSYSATIIEENNLFKYGVDYDLGDFVTIVDDELDIEVVAQITEITVSEQDTGEYVDITLSYGNPVYDFTKQIKQDKLRSEENGINIKYLESQLKKNASGRGGDTPVISNIDDMTVNFDAADERTQIVKTDPIKKLFGKIAKWYNDLKTVAFTGSYSDLRDKPNLFSGDYNDLSNKPNIPVVPTYNGGVSTILNDNLSQKKVLISNEDGKVAASSITDTLLGYLSGATENIQNQVNRKQNIISLGSNSIHDLDSIFVGSIWYNVEQVTAGTLPFNNYGFIMGFKAIPNGSSAFQIAIPYGGTMSIPKWRTHVNNVWQPWKYFSNFENTIHIADSGTNCNSFTNLGMYFKSAFDSSSDTNYPYSGGGWLEVYNYIGSTGTIYVFQRYTVWNKRLVYTRFHNQNGWTAWNQVAGEVSEIYKFQTNYANNLTFTRRDSVCSFIISTPKNLKASGETLLGTLPSNFRPSVEVVFNTVEGGSPNNQIRIIISANGEFRIWNYTTKTGEMNIADVFMYLAK